MFAKLSEQGTEDQELQINVRPLGSSVNQRKPTAAAVSVLRLVTRLRRRLPARRHGPTIWLFTGSLRTGQPAAAVMSLVHPARLNGHDPYAYLRDMLERLPIQPASRIRKLLRHTWQPEAHRRRAHTAARTTSV